MRKMPSVPFALLSGAFGAAASCLAKFAFSGDTFLTKWTLQACELNLSGNAEHCDALTMAVRGCCFVGTLVLNIVMVGSFLEGMEESGSVAGTALSNAANFVVSSVLGFLLWEEDVSTKWLFGFVLVILGTLLLASVKAGSPPRDAEEDTRHQQKKND